MIKKTSGNYAPPQKILKKYADVLVNFALSGGKGIKKGDVVVVHASEIAKPLFIELLRAVWKAGGHAISNYSTDSNPSWNHEREFYTIAKPYQIKFFPRKYMKGMAEEAHHSIAIMAETNMRALEGIQPKKIMERGIAFRPFHQWKRTKEDRGKFSWTIGLYGTEAMAKEASISLKEYWEQIIKACFLNKADPILEWKKIYKKLEAYRRKLTSLPIKKLHIQGTDADLWISMGKKRRWMGGGGRNIPSFELFASPDWRGTEGWIRFNQPLYRYGNLITGIKLEFKGGRVVKSSARRNEKVLKQMIATPGADKIGEYSLTDRRFSKITKFMAHTLYDENIGGRYGNTHIALGNSYHDCFEGNPATLSNAEWEKLGFNNSSVHTDIISTAPRTVTAYLKGGRKKIIYRNGQFTL